MIEQYLESRYRLLDLDTGGGEFLLSLRHPYSNTSATEAYPPNVRLCEKTLCPLGVDFHRADASEDLPFEDEAFDIVINRHGSFCVSELHRVVKRGGIFITEQVGAENDGLGGAFASGYGASLSRDAPLSWYQNGSKRQGL